MVKTDFNYGGDFVRVPTHMKVYLQLIGYFATQYDENIIKNAEDSAKIAADLLMKTDNPVFYLMWILQRKKMLLSEIKEMVDSAIENE